jgi:segregation and condensation protein B
MWTAPRSLTQMSCRNVSVPLRTESSLSGVAWLWRVSSANSSDTLAFPSANRLTGLRTPKMARVEAVLFVADSALSSRKLAQFALLSDPTEARTLVRQLNELYDRQGSSFRVEQVAAGYRLLTRPVFAHWLAKLHQRQAELKLTAPALETLSIVAYRQPITRADVEAIRGVSCIEMLKQLMDRGLVKIGGADDSLGRPHLYETTRGFLEIFGLKGIEDLPLANRLRKQTANVIISPPVEQNEAA